MELSDKALFGIFVVFFNLLCLNLFLEHFNKFYIWVTKKMASINEKVVDAIISLHSNILDINDFKEVPSILETAIQQIFHIDWLGIFYFSEDFKTYNCVTNPFLPFDWNEKYQTISDIDVIRENTFRLGVGDTYLHETKVSPENDKELFLLEAIKKYTDTSQFLILQTGKGRGYNSGIGLYRTEKKHYFSSDDKAALDYLSPVLVSISQMMRFYRDFDFKRAGMEEIQKASEHMAFILNDKLMPVDIPQKTVLFFQQNFRMGNRNPIPDFLDNWIKNVIAQGCTLKPNTGPWAMKMPLNSFDLYCKANVILTGMGQLALLVQLIPHGVVPEFGKLRSLGLTKRETEALSYLPLGYTNQQIALAMNLQEVTVKKHLKNAAEKLGASGRTETLFQSIQKKKILEFSSDLA